MSKIEKRILVLEVNPDCKALYVDYGDPLDPDGGMFCDKSGKWVRITEKDCAKCKSPVLAGLSRAEAVEIMANAFIKYDRDCDKSKPLNPYEAMEAALDALLGKEAENGK